MSVPALDWPAAATAVLNTQLGSAAPAPLAVPLQLPADEVKRIAARPPGTITDTLALARQYLKGIELPVPPRQ